MYISSLSLMNFRNYENQKIRFSPYTNLIYGDNAQGKTNILEALYLFSQGRSHRTKLDRELIKFGADSARLKLKFHDSDRDYTALMQLVRNGRKTININHIPITKLSMLMNYLNIVMFSPEDLNLIKGSPSARRQFIDSAISQLYPAYLISLTEYHKALVQKSSLLKSIKRGADKTMLSVWNEQLAKNCARIMNERNAFIKELCSFAKVIQKEISNEDFDVHYVPSIRVDKVDADTIFNFLELHSRREIEFKSALYGIQRDDINVFINNNNARIYGSQGQQRSATLSLKIAQAEYIHSVKGEYPVLLLDDIMSELDINRRTYLAEKIKNKQVFITSTDTDLVKSTDQTKLFYVKQGQVYEGE